MDFCTRDNENLFPECGTTTISSIKDSNEMGIYVSLLEFDNIEGLLLFSEVSRRKIRSITKLIKIGKKEIVSIIRVDNDKSYIDVSKRQITEIEINVMKKKRIFGKIGNLISNNIGRFLCLNFEENRLRWVWQLCRKFNHILKAYKQVLKIDKFFITSIDFSEKEIKVLFDHLKKKLPISQIKIEVEFEMICFSPNGIHVLKNAIINTKNTPLFFNIQCKTLVSPRYLISLCGKEKKKTLKKINVFLNLMSEKILLEKGTFRINKINFI